MKAESSARGAGDRIEIVPGACIFRAIELPEIAGGPGRLPRAGLGDGHFASAVEVVVEVLFRHQRCARRKVWLVGGREWLAGGRRGGAAATAGGERQGASQHRDGRLQDGMVVLLAPPTTLADKRWAGWLDVHSRGRGHSCVLRTGGLRQAEERAPPRRHRSLDAHPPAPPPSPAP